MSDDKTLMFFKPDRCSTGTYVFFCSYLFLFSLFFCCCCCCPSLPCRTYLSVSYKYRRINFYIYISISISLSYQYRWTASCVWPLHRKQNVDGILAILIYTFLFSLICGYAYIIHTYIKSVESFGNMDRNEGIRSCAYIYIYIYIFASRWKWMIKLSTA